MCGMVVTMGNRGLGFVITKRFLKRATLSNWWKGSKVGMQIKPPILAYKHVNIYAHTIHTNACTLTPTQTHTCAHTLIYTHMY